MARRKKRTDVDALKSEYDQLFPRAVRLCECVSDQLTSLLDQHGVALGVPMETRVKQWGSIREKIDRKTLHIGSLLEMQDLVGLRTILLFKRDISILDNLIKDNFEIISVEDTGSRLDASQFGYQSQHYVIRILPGWQKIPSYRDLGRITAEIQVRTLAQHIWAAASHKLQYKREESVPPPLRRTIHRVSALLEIVDLEFSRVLEERTEYISETSPSSLNEEILNVDLVKLIAEEVLPPDNRDDVEKYDALLGNLTNLGVLSARDFRNLLIEQKSAALKADAAKVEEFRRRSPLPDWISVERLAKGVYFTHTGLVRQALFQRFGEEPVRAAMEKSRDS